MLYVRGQLAQLKAGEAPRIVAPKSVRPPHGPLLPRLQAALEALYEATTTRRSCSVPAAGRGSPGIRLRRSVVEAGVRAKLGHVILHVLRRTTGSALSEARVPEAASTAIMGHSLEVFHRAHVNAHRDASSVIARVRRLSSSGSA